jgi:ribosomal protein L12E/L44/L45/RPP1/RPP2
MSEFAFQDPGPGTTGTTMVDMWDEQVCICMWTEVNGPVGPNEKVEKKGKLKFMDDLVDVLYRNMEEYAMNREGYVASGKELPFIVHYLSPSWLSKVEPIQLSQLLDYFCRVDRDKPEGERLVVTKADLFALISSDKGRDAFEKMLKGDLGFKSVAAKAVVMPFKTFIKYLETMNYNELELVSRYGASTAGEGGEGKDDMEGDTQIDDDDDDNDESEEEEEEEDQDDD